VPSMRLPPGIIRLPPELLVSLPLPIDPEKLNTCESSTVSPVRVQFICHPLGRVMPASMLSLGGGKGRVPSPETVGRKKVRGERMPINSLRALRVRGDQWGVVVGLYITETGQGRELEPVLRSIAKKHEAGLALGGLEVSQKRGSKRQRVAALRKVRHAGCHCEDSRLQKKKAPPPARLVAQGFVDTLPTDHDRPGHKARSVVDITPARAVRLAALVACLQDRAAFGAAQDGACPTSAVARAERPFWHRLHQVAIKAARGTNARFPVKDAFARHRHSTATFCHISNGAERQTRFPRISSTHRW